MQEDKIVDNEYWFQFIIEDFKQSSEHMRQYDNTIFSLAKFSFSICSAVAAISSAVIRYFYIENPSPVAAIFLTTLMVFTYCVNDLIVAIIIRNRMYYVNVARHTNSIRKYFLSLNNDNNFNNILCGDITLPLYFNKDSSHYKIFNIILIANTVLASYVIASVVLFIYYSIYPLSGNKPIMYGIGFIGFVGILMIWLTVKRTKAVIKYFLNKGDNNEKTSSCI